MNIINDSSFNLHNSGDARGVIVIVVGNEHGDTSLKPVKLHLKIDLVSYPARVEGLVNRIIVFEIMTIGIWMLL